MNCTIKRFVIAVACAVFAVSVLWPGEARIEARGGSVPTYCSGGSNVFWFVHASDLHIGTSGSTDSTNLSWLVTTGRTVIAPLFTVVTGDLTDSTNGNIFGYPTGPYQAEWDQYKAILSAAGITRKADGSGSDIYYDIPGNHDAYSDRYFAYYRANAIQGGTYSPGGQVAWTKNLAFGTYHFVGVNTADNTGAAFSFIWPYGDHAGLDTNELAALSSDLTANAGASATFVFGHHPVASVGGGTDTYLYYGAPEFVSTLSANGVPAYDYGHIHDNVETIFTGTSETGTIAPGIRYSRVASLGKDSPNFYSVISVDCNGVNSVTQAVGSWPVVLITAPVSRYVGSAVNPYAYSVPAVAGNPIRALVFDNAGVSQVRFRVDSAATWASMVRSDTEARQWSGTWDASAAAAGEHTIEVQATGTAIKSHVIKVNVTGANVNHAPVAVDDRYSTTRGNALTVAAPGVLWNDTDQDGDTLTASVVGRPGHGTVSLSTNGSFTYTPAAGFSGTDTFSYQASDGTLAATASVTITVTAATADTVTITSATWTRKTKKLAVKATSSSPGTAVLTVSGYGQMSYSSKTRSYSLSAPAATAPSSVTVTSSLGGSATAAVIPK